MRLGLRRGRGLLARPDTLWLAFLRDLPDFSGAGNSYRESLPLLGFRSGATGSVLMKPD